jgi:hypothetical protein
MSGVPHRAARRDAGQPAQAAVIFDLRSLLAAGQRHYKRCAPGETRTPNLLIRSYWYYCTGTFIECIFAGSAANRATTDTSVFGPYLHELRPQLRPPVD